MGVFIFVLFIDEQFLPDNSVIVWDVSGTVDRPRFKDFLLIFPYFSDTAIQSIIKTWPLKKRLKT